MRATRERYCVPSPWLPRRTQTKAEGQRLTARLRQRTADSMTLGGMPADFDGKAGLSEVSIPQGLS